MTSQPYYDAAQLAAIQTDAARAVVLSCAGSGKTRTLIGRVEELMRRGVAPQQIVTITYTQAAGRVLQERLKCKIGYAGTLHAFCLRLLNQHSALVGYSPGIGIVDDERKESVLAQLKAAQRYKGTEQQLEAALAAGAAVAGTARNLTPPELVAHAYWRQLRTNNAMDFDMVLAAGKLLIDKLRLRNEWPYAALFVDEMQDASPQQAACYDAMPVRWRFSAGDAAQSIYSFLGGDVKNIMDEAGKCGAGVFRLETSYRCCKAVCAAATRLMAATGLRTLPRLEAPTGQATLAEYEDFQHEVKGIAQQIRALDTEQSCAVLLRTNALAAEYALALEAYGLPISHRKDTGDPQDWRMVKALLACLVQPDNDLLAEGFIVALKGKEIAEESRRAAIAKQVSLNAHCLHFPCVESAADAVAYVVGKQPSAASQEKLLAVAGALEQDATVGDLLVSLQDPVKHEATPGVFCGTIHASKGGEWDTVVLPAFEEGVIPSNRDAKDADALAEAKRIAYVAFTRAKQNLLVSWSRTRRERFGRREAAEMQPSRFAAEAGLVSA